MKRIVFTGAVLALGILVAVCLLSPQSRPTGPAPSGGPSEGPSTNADIAASSLQREASKDRSRTTFFPSRAERNRMSDAQLVRWLEKNGELPKDATRREWHLAEKTSWWGKPLDPKEFWKGRVIWLDEEARSAANRRGRRYPPIPYDLNPA